MRVSWANLRSSSAPWLLLPVLVYAALYIDDAVFTEPSEYGVESGELAARALVVIAPAVAAAAAWEAGRHRVLRALDSTARRGPVRRFLRSASPVLALLLVLVAGSLAIAHHETGVFPGGAAGWLAVAHLLVVPLGWLLIGRSLGGVAPASITAPAVALACWAWLSIPLSMRALWVRHLGGYSDQMSSITDLRSPAAYLVPWGVVAGLVLACQAATTLRPRPLAAVAAVALVAATLVTGRALVTDWGDTAPSTPRSTALTCVGSAPRVCVPPEYAPHAATIRDEVLEPVRRLAAAGIPAPRELRIASAELPLAPGTWPLYWSPPPREGRPSPDEYAANLAESAVTGTAAAAGRTDCRRPGSTAAAWAALVDGVDAQSVQAALPPPEWEALQKVRARPAAAQATWFTDAAVSGRHCQAVS
ncbi:DUF7224 domain-containing protein [Streptomyces sp. NPDC001493]